MNKKLIATAAFLVAAVLSNRINADDTTCSLGDAGTLHVQLPAGWTGKTDGQSPPTIRLKSADGKNATIQITTIAPANSNAKLKSEARQACSEFVEGSAEKKIKLEEIHGDNVHGYLSSFTDTAADTGEPHFITAGAVNSNKVVMSVIVLCVDKTSDDHTAAMDAIKSLSASTDGATAPTATATNQPAEPPAAPEAKDLQIKSPDGSWALTVPGKWTRDEDAKPSDGKTLQMNVSADDGRSMLTISFEPAARSGDAKVARDYYFDNMHENTLMMQNAKKDAVGDVATLEYDEGPDGFKQHNLNAYVSHGGAWVTIHYAKANFDEKADRDFLDGIVKGLKAE